MPVLTDSQAYAVIVAAGFAATGKPSAAMVAFAIACAESGLDTAATNTAGNTPPSTDRGLFQINSYWHSEVADVCAFDANCAARQAYRISSQGTDFTPWSTYGGGQYKQYLARAAAAAGMESQPVVSQLVLNVEARLPRGGEFQGKNGDCTEYSYMVGDAGLDPQEPCDAAELNRLTNAAIAGSEAGASGAMTAVNLAWLSVKDNHPYLQSSDWRSLLSQHIGKLPVVMQFANGQALPGNEQGVQGHAVVYLDGDYNAGHFTVANGDSVNGRNGQLDTVSMQDTLNAQPFACTVLLAETGVAAVSIAIERDASGAITGAKDDQNGHTVGGGYAREIQAQGWEGATIAVPEVFGLAEGATFCVLRGAARVAMTYSAAHGVQAYGDDVVAVLNDVYNVWQSAKNQPAAAPTPTLDVAGVKTDLTTAVQALTDAQAKLAKG